MKSPKFLLPLFLVMTVSCSQAMGSPGIFGERHYEDIDYSLYYDSMRGRLFVWEYNGMVETALTYRNGYYSASTFYTEILYLQKFYPCPLPIMKDILFYRFGSNKDIPLDIDGFQIFYVSCPVEKNYLHYDLTDEEYEILLETCDYLNINHDALKHL